MNSHEWHALFSFGLLAGALSIYDPQLAVYVVGIATLVILVKNANAISEVLG